MLLVRKRIAALLIIPCAWLLGQAPPPPPAPQTQVQPLSPDQLDNLVAPIALYPDPLLAQVLAASTYPLEVVEAQQWLQQNSNLHGAELMDAAKRQNWDASVQALVAFPDALSLLNRDIRWTTDLGNAFLAQQSDVMAAVQRMRARAQQNGKLVSTPQQTVTTETQDGQSAITIQPADPEVIYVPVYNPVYVWGPPVWGYYPPLWYPDIAFGFGFGPGIYLSVFFPGWGGFGWPGWGPGWGWGCGWFGGTLFVNNFFYDHYGFRDYHQGGYRRFAGGGREGWEHDPYHRAGVPYNSQAVASRFNNQRFAAGRQNFSAGSFAGSRPVSSANAARSFGGRAFSGTSTGNFGRMGSQASRGATALNRSGGPANIGRALSGGAVNSGSFGRFNQGSARAFGGSQTFPRNPGANFGYMSRGFSPAPSFSPRSFGGGGFRGPSFSGGGFGGRSTFGGGFRGPSFSGGGFGGRSTFGGGGRSFGGGGLRGGRR